MTEEDKILQEVTTTDYKYGFVTDIDSDTINKGLNEDVIRLISMKKNEPDWLLEWRLDAFRKFQKMTEPEWANVTYDKPDLQSISYYSAPKPKKTLEKVHHCKTASASPLGRVEGIHALYPAGADQRKNQENFRTPRKT